MHLVVPILYLALEVYQTKGGLMDQDKPSRDSLGNIKSRNLYRKLLGGSLAGLIVFLFIYTLIPTLVSEAHAAEDVSAAITWQAISLTLDPHGDINFYDVIPSQRDASTGAYGTQKVIKKQIDVTTEGQYYAVYLSTASTDNSLSVSGDSARSIPATSDSLTSGFAQSSWGYAAPTSETSGTFSAYDSFLANAPGAETTANNLTKTGTGSNVYNTGKWLAVPGLGGAAQIHKNSTNAISGFNSGDSFDIYYSIMVDTDILSGVYENQVLYTAIASTTSLDTLSENIMRDKATAYSMLDETETLEIDLAATSSALSPSDIKIYLVPHDVITTNNYDISTLTSTDYPECITESVDTAGVTDSGISATITCTLPPLESTGTTSSDYEIEQGGEYDFWVIINTPGGHDTINYLSHYRSAETNIASITYSTGIGLQTVHAIDGDPENAEAYVQIMQEMTETICQNTNMWGSVVKYDSNTRASDMSVVRLYNSQGETSGSEVTHGVDKSGAVDNIGTFELTDARDQNNYKVRRLADGECWMVEDLKLDLTTIGTLSLSDSDVLTSWTPNVEEISQPIVSGDTSPRFSITDDGLYKYNWYAATRNIITSEESGVANESICPLNWQLPTWGGWSTPKAAKSHDALFRDNTVYYFDDTQLSYEEYMARTDKQTIVEIANAVPFSFENNDDSSWWENQAFSETNARTFFLTWYGIYPGYGGYYTERWQGNSVRCVARD